jgi:DNA topoisomerase-1
MLRHSSDTEPGFTRRRIGGHWVYFDGDTRVTDRATIDRLNAIALPPAYEHAWFSKDPDGHLQATGIDRRRRKQYRYHTKFREERDNVKFQRMIEFGEALPRIRARVEKDLRKPILKKEKVLAGVVRLLDDDFLRVGNRAYARDNQSFGATTLLDRQLVDDGRRMRVRFTGKSGVEHEVAITDRTLRRLVRRLHELPGQTLFQYVDAAGTAHPINSTEVNEYIRRVSGGHFTAKDFRTWGATVIAFEQMLQKAENRRISINRMIEPAAEALGNTVAISRKSYVHPALIEAVRHNPRDPLAGFQRPPPGEWQSSCEVGLIGFLSERARGRPGAAAVTIDQPPEIPT